MRMHVALILRCRAKAQTHCFHHKFALGRKAAVGEKCPHFVVAMGV
jgi:hypothetical protein